MPLKDRYQSEKWKEYQRTYHRSWHQRHRQKRLARVYERRVAIREYIQDIKNQLYCADCGERHPATLQFHHRNSEDKTFAIGKAVNRGFSLDRIKKEMQKCIVLCANCHAIRHYNMQKNIQPSPGIAGQLEALNTLLSLSPEEEEAYNAQFGES
jgi:transcription elongation factor Elf1